MKNMLKCYAIYCNGVYVYRTIAREKIGVVKEFLLKYMNKEFKLTTTGITTIEDFLGFIGTPDKQIEQIVSNIKLVKYDEKAQRKLSPIINYLVIENEINYPLHLILALLVSTVLIPIAAYAMGSLFFGSNPNLVCGIVLEYSVPVAVTAFMWISMFGGNGPLALTIILTSSVISPVTIPLTLKLLLGATVAIDVPGMMQNMAFMIAIPAILGIVINELTCGWGHEKLSPALSPACKFMMMGVIASNSTAMSEYVLHMNVERLEVALFILAFAISGFIIGILVARALHLPYSETTTMCFTCGMRNISSGAVIATQYFPGEVVFPVMCGTLFQQVLASIIGHLFERLTGEERAKQRKRVKAGRDAMAR